MIHDSVFHIVLVYSYFFMMLTNWYYHRACNNYFWFQPVDSNKIEVEQNEVSLFGCQNSIMLSSKLKLIMHYFKSNT